MTTTKKPVARKMFKQHSEQDEQLVLYRPEETDETENPDYRRRKKPMTDPKKVEKMRAGLILMAFREYLSGEFPKDDSKLTAIELEVKKNFGIYPTEIQIEKLKALEIEFSLL